jgi:hypothetical protein
MSSAREWEDPKVVPANEVSAYCEDGWEPCGPCMMQATNNATGEKTMILAWGIKRRFSPVRAVLESSSGVARARVVQPLPSRAR